MKSYFISIMAYKTPPSDKYPNWTTAKYWSFIRSGLRQKWMRWPPKFECLKLAKIDVTGQGRTRFNYRCAACRGLFKGPEVEVDHITPAGSLNCYKDLPGFVERLFAPVADLRVVCKPCHKAITKAERDARKL